MAKKAAKLKVGRPVNKDSDETRREILDAARVCFANAGFRATSTRNIADRAGVTVGSIYHYFKNKDELFLAVYHEIQETSLNMAREALQGATSLTSGWAGLNEKMFAMHRDHPDIAKFNVVVEIEAMQNPKIAVALYDREWRAHFEGLAQLAVETGEIQPGQEKELVLVMAAIAQGISRHAIQAPMEDHKLCLQGFVNLFDGNLVRPASSGKKSD